MFEPYIGEWTEISKGWINDQDEDLDKYDLKYQWSLKGVVVSVMGDNSVNIYTLGEAKFDIEQLKIVHELICQKTLPPCGKQEKGDNDDGTEHIYGTCQRYQGHQGRHVEIRNGELWCEW